VQGSSDEALVRRTRVVMVSNGDSELSLHADGVERSQVVAQVIYDVVRTPSLSLQSLFSISRSIAHSSSSIAAITISSVTIIPADY